MLILSTDVYSEIEKYWFHVKSNHENTKSGTRSAGARAA